MWKIRHRWWCASDRVQKFGNLVFASPISILFRRTPRHFLTLQNFRFQSETKSFLSSQRQLNSIGIGVFCHTIGRWQNATLPAIFHFFFTHLICIYWRWEQVLIKPFKLWLCSPAQHAYSNFALKLNTWKSFSARPKITISMAIKFHTLNLNTENYRIFFSATFSSSQRIHFMLICLVFCVCVFFASFDLIVGSSGHWPPTEKASSFESIHLNKNCVCISYFLF